MGTLTWLMCAFALLGVCCGYVDKTVYQYLVDNGYSYFIQLLKETGQDGLLQGPGHVTVFAPTNTAIANMPPDVMATMARNAWQKSELVKYHMIHDIVMLPLIVETKHIITMAGQTLDIRHLGNSIILNNKTLVNDSNDVICRNGVVLPIESVLLPPLYATDNLVATLIERDDLFGAAVIRLVLFNITQLLENGEFTIFAPIDSAYLKFSSFLENVPVGSIEPIPQEDLDMGRREMYKYHIIPGARTFEQLMNGQQLVTLHGTPLNITTMANGKYVDQARITHPNIPASNGIIHGIDDTLFPRDLLHVVPSEVHQLLVG